MIARRGFTLVEMLVVAMIVGVLAALGMDLFKQRDEERLHGAARMLEQDIEWARSATLTDPDDPASVRLLEDGSGWMVVRRSAPTTPLTAADGSPMRRTLGEGMSQAAAGVKVAGMPEGSRSIDFEAFGGVKPSSASIELFLPDSETNCLITFESGSGAIQVAWTNPQS
jgi:prepilin-type N-terminal cleavage/methylation domain-containing protein